MNILTKKNIQYASQVILGGIFVYASIGKILRPASFSVAISNYKLLPHFLVKPVAIILSGTELTFGITLLLGVGIRISAIFLSSLLLIFIAAIFISIIRGLNIDCGCFEKFFQEAGLNNTNPWILIFRDILFLVPGIIIIFFLKMRGKEV